MEIYNNQYRWNNRTTGNLASKAGVNYTYDTNHPHAVASLSNGNSYSYDANGNMTQRVVNGQTFNLGYDAENRMVGVTGPSMNVAFTYDADGKRVQQVLNSITTKFIGNHYEIEGTTVRKYYFAGSTRIAMRTGTGTPVYFLQDHLGSTSITTDSSGSLVSELLFKAWGENRYSNGTIPTKYTYTGQYSNEGDFGLMYYGARWYDSSLGRFSQPDSIIPGAGNPQAYDRYAYVFNNPINATDPTGHIACWDEENVSNCDLPEQNPYDFNDVSDQQEPESVVVIQKPNPYTPPSIVPTPVPVEESGFSIGPDNGSSNPVKALDPLEPDYISITISVGEGGGITVNLIIDRYGNVYIGAGGNIGKSLTPLSGSITLGWIGDSLDNYFPGPEESANFFTGFSINAGLGFLGGGGVTLSPSSIPLGYELGIYSPQIGISAIGSTQLIKVR